MELESEVGELGERVGCKSGRCKYGVREWEVRERSSCGMHEWGKSECEKEGC